MASGRIDPVDDPFTMGLPTLLRGMVTSYLIRQGARLATAESVELAAAEGAAGSLGQAAGGVVNQTSKAILKNGYYEVNGFKFSEYYYNKLWSTGRGGHPGQTHQNLA